MDGSLPRRRLASQGDDPTIKACLYPQTVGLTRLLASPYWYSRALRAPEGDPAFIQEVRRTVTADYIWDPNSDYRYYDPLVRWFNYERVPDDYYPRCNPMHVDAL